MFSLKKNNYWKLEIIALWILIGLIVFAKYSNKATCNCSEKINKIRNYIWQQKSDDDKSNFAFCIKEAQFSAIMGDKQRARRELLKSLTILPKDDENYFQTLIDVSFFIKAFSISLPEWYRLTLQEYQKIKNPTPQERLFMILCSYNQGDKANALRLLKTFSQDNFDATSEINWGFRKLFNLVKAKNDFYFEFQIIYQIKASFMMKLIWFFELFLGILNYIFSEYFAWLSCGIIGTILFTKREKYSSNFKSHGGLNHENRGA